MVFLLQKKLIEIDNFPRVRQSAAMDFKELNRWRRANKNYDPRHKIDHATILRIIDEAVLAPSSMNMQGTKVIAVVSEEERKRLHGVAWKQQQILDASAVLIILGNHHAYKNVQYIYEQSQGVPAEVVKTMVGYAENLYAKDVQKQRDEALRSSSLFAMTTMLAAANEGYASCPMGGFDAEGVSREFGIHHPYFPVMLISLGKQSQVPFVRPYRYSASEITNFR